MTEPLTPNPHDEPTPDETFTWTGDSAGENAEARADSGSTGSSGSPGSTGSTGSAGASAAGRATAILEQLREAVDDLAERASPTVREFSARAAELVASAADKAAPLAKRAGEATSEASGKLAERSRTWASELHASAGTHDAGAPGSGTDTSPATPPPAPDAGNDQSDHANPA